MKHLKKILIAVIIISSLFIIINLVGGYVSRETYIAPKAEAKVEVVKEVELLTHAQKVWISALEWCESRATDDVNPKDKDGTPSYHWFQFKPSTFKGYGTEYGVISSKLTQNELMEKMKDQKVQQMILEYMVYDHKNINWEQQFPGCVKKLGRPPTY